MVIIKKLGFMLHLSVALRNKQAKCSKIHKKKCRRGGGQLKVNIAAESEIKFRIKLIILQMILALNP